MAKSNTRLSGAGVSRRRFLQQTSATALGATASLPLTGRFPVHPGGDEEIKVGLIGCGGRGTGAAAQALHTAGPVKLVAMADAFADRLESSLRHLRGQNLGERVDVAKERCFTGFDAYKELLALDLNLVVIATPPHFRPDHFEAAINAGKHVFFEKPVAVDGWGVRKVLAAAELAKQKKLAVVSGLQRHHQNGYLELMQRVHDGAIGDIVAARCYWNMGGLWMHPRKPEWSDMEWQMRNWLYFTWLSGDHITEQHVHNLDVINWAKRAHPVRCHGIGGRQVRTDPAYGHIFDHHGVHYEFADGAWMFSQCRQIDGCSNRVAEHLIGSTGSAEADGGKWQIDARVSGASGWSYDGPRNNPYQTEHDDLFRSIRDGQPLNEGTMVAESTLTAIMGRMATYTGQEVTWEQALLSERLGPATYEFGELAVDPVPMPGKKA
jgi:predicted dehydrogenase